MTFDWDRRKAASNLRKHGVSFEEATDVFLTDESAYSDFDTGHSDDDIRFFTIGTTSSGKILRISHNEDGGLIRLINARHATPPERRLYEENDSESI